MYKWASNQLKLQRAIAKANYNQTPDEQSVKDIYVSFGGLVNPGYETEEIILKVKVPVEEVREWVGSTGTEEVIPSGDSNTEVSAVIGKKKGRPKKNVE